MTIHNKLPAHQPIAEQLSLATGDLRVEGLAWRTAPLTQAELNELPHVSLMDDFTCEEGWRVEGLAWEGVALREVVRLCLPLPTARYVRVSAGEFWHALALDDLDQALLCDRLNGTPLSHEHGAPWRLILPSGVCFSSVKWVSALTFAAEPGEPTNERIARARIAQE